MRWNGMQGRYYDFKDGDNFMWKDRKLATLIHHNGSDGCNWWTIQVYDEGEREMFLGYDADLPQEKLDDICQIFYNGIVWGLVFNSKTESAALKSIPVSM